MVLLFKILVKSEKKRDKVDFDIYYNFICIFEKINISFFWEFYRGNMFFCVFFF